MQKLKPTKTRRVPSEEKIPNAKTLEAMKEAQLGRNLKRFKSVGDLFKSFNSSIKISDDRAVDYFKSTIYKKLRSSMTPGLWIKNLREAHGLTQSQLGKKLGGVNTLRIAGYEKNEVTVNKSIAIKLSKLFRIPADRFIKSASKIPLSKE